MGFIYQSNKIEQMKHLVLNVVLIASLGTQCAKAQKKEFQEEISKEISFEKSTANNLLVVQNLNGSIHVEGYDGDKILLAVEKLVTANSEKDLELGKTEVGIHVVEQGSEIVIYPDLPNMEYKNGHLTSINCRDYEEPPYDHNLNFQLRIPKNIKLNVGAINNGEVVVRNTKGNYIKANNINGGITLENITGQTEVHAINGEVSISYATNPASPSIYYSLNGNITITYQEDLSAEIAFKSMNGELFTDFDIAGQYVKTSQNEPQKNGKGKYKYEAKPVVQIGDGSMLHDFETLNGNVIIKKI